MTKPPLILADNFFDRINLYVNATLSSSGDLPGRLVQYVADYRRERTYWQAATSASSRYVRVDLGAGVSRPADACWIDRGHNLWGRTVAVEASGDNFGTTPNAISRAVPAFGTVGGDPETTWCVTEEGALYTLFSPFTARRYHQVRVVTSSQPIIPGVIVGARTQLLSYSSIRDEDAAGRVERTAESEAGYQAHSTVHAYRELALRLAMIGASEYDGQIRALRQLLFELNQPAVIAMNYGTHPARAWLYRYSGRSWGFPMARVHRSGDIRMREEGPLII